MFKNQFNILYVPVLKGYPVFIKSSNARQIELFQRLLAHLVLQKLQPDDDRVNACLAIQGAFYDSQQALTVHSSSNSNTLGYIEVNSETLMEYIRGDEVVRDKILSKFIGADQYISVAPQVKHESPRIIPKDEPKNPSRVKSWLSLFPIPGNVAPMENWREIFESVLPGFSLESGNPFLFYLYSFMKYPTIPAIQWVNICTYRKYDYEKLTLGDLFFRNGVRSALASNPELFEVDSNRVFSFSDPDANEDISYGAGSWIVGGVALTEQSYSDGEDSIYKYAVCLDSAKQIIDQFSESQISAGIKAFAIDKRVPDENKFVAMFALLEHGGCDPYILDALKTMNTITAPSTQLGMLNQIWIRNEDLRDWEFHKSKRKALADLTMLWIEKRSPFDEWLNDIGTDDVYQEIERGFEVGRNKKIDKTDSNN